LHNCLHVFAIVMMTLKKIV